MSLSSDLKIISKQKTVTTAGTKEPLDVGPDETRVRGLVIVALTTNTGKVYVGDDTVSSSVGTGLDPGDSISFEVEAREWEMGLAINMAKIYLDVDTSGEGVSFTFVRE